MKHGPGASRTAKGGAPAGSNFAYVARLTELALLGVLALRSRKVIAWDPINLKARGAPETDALVRGSYVVNSSQGGGSKDTWVLESKKS